MLKIKKAFTIVELIIATVISAIVLLLIFALISNTIWEISYSVEESRFLTSYNELFVKLKEYRNLYTSWTILIDNEYWSWSDVLIFDNWIWWQGVIFWVVDKQTMQIESISNYSIYRDKVMWYRFLSEWEVSELKSNPTKVYDYLFYEDKCFNELKIKDFQLTSYNSWSVIEADIGFIVPFEEWLINTNFNNIWSENIRKIISNF